MMVKYFIHVIKGIWTFYPQHLTEYTKDKSREWSSSNTGIK